MIKLMQKNFYKQAFTIIELLIVFAVLALLFAVVLPRFSDVRENQVLANAVADILSAVNKARSESLASVNSSEYGLHFQADRVIIFKGKVFSAASATNEIINITPPARISNVTLSGTTAASGDMYFSRLYAVPNITGTITVASNSLSKIITIYPTGVASVN